MNPYIPNAPKRNNIPFSLRMVFSLGTKKPIIQNAIAAKVHLSVTPVRGLIHKGNKYFSAFIFNPLNVFEMTMQMLASVFLFFTD